MKIYVFMLNIFCLTFFNSLSAQNVLDFFIPETPYNKTTTFMPDNETGKPTGLVTVRYYVKNGSHVEILKAEFTDDKFGYKTTSNYILSNNEIIEITKYGNRPFLKLPNKLGDTLNLNRDQEVITYVLLNIKMNDGSERLAIKKTTQPKLMQSALVEYYLNGIGFWKRVITSSKSSKTITYEKFQKLDIDKTIRGDNN